MRADAGSGAGAGTTKIELADVTLGTQGAAQNVYTYYPVSGLGSRLLISKFTITPSGAGLYDIDVRSDNGTGTSYLAARDANGEYLITIPVYIEGDADGVIWVGIKNKSTSSRTYTLTALRAEKFA